MVSIVFCRGYSDCWCWWFSNEIFKYKNRYLWIWIVSLKCVSKWMGPKLCLDAQRYLWDHWSVPSSVWQFLSSSWTDLTGSHFFGDWVLLWYMCDCHCLSARVRSLVSKLVVRKGFKHRLLSLLWLWVVCLSIVWKVQDWQVVARGLRQLGSFELRNLEKSDCREDCLRNQQGWTNFRGDPASTLSSTTPVETGHDTPTFSKPFTQIAGLFWKQASFQEAFLRCWKTSTWQPRATR